MLIVSALDRIRQCMNYMLEDGVMKWQGNLRATYDKYFLPELLDLDDETMWQYIKDGRILNLFQFESIVKDCDII